MDRFSRLLAGLLGRAAGLLPGRRREWAEAALAESGEVPAGPRRAVWLGGGLWLVTRETLTRGGRRMIAFAAGPRRSCGSAGRVPPRTPPCR